MDFNALSLKKRRRRAGRMVVSQETGVCLYHDLMMYILKETYDTNISICVEVTSVGLKAPLVNMVFGHMWNFSLQLDAFAGHGFAGHGPQTDSRQPFRVQNTNHDTMSMLQIVNMLRMVAATMQEVIRELRTLQELHPAVR